MLPGRKGREEEKGADCYDFFGAGSPPPTSEPVRPPPLCSPLLFGSISSVPARRTLVRSPFPLPLPPFSQKTKSCDADQSGLCFLQEAEEGGDGCCVPRILCLLAST